MISNSRNRNLVSHVDSDNPQPGTKDLKGLREGNRTIAQRTREALGNIGNRINKPSGVQPKPGAGAMKPTVNALKSLVGGSKVADTFAVPNARPLKANIKQESNNNTKKLIDRSNSVSAFGYSKNVSKPEVKLVKAKIFTNIHRSQTVSVKASGSCGDKVRLISQPVQQEFKKEVASAPTIIPEDHENFKPQLEVPIKNENAVGHEENVPDIGGLQITCDKTEDEPDLMEVLEPEMSTHSNERFSDVQDIDADDDNNPVLAKEFIKDICDYMFALEKKFPIRVRYLEGRLINSRMRGVLLDWLVEVHYQFGFTPETFYMAAKTLDRYLQKERSVTRKQLQLVGVTSLYLAAKFEEVCTPTVLDFSAVSDNAFSTSDVREMERDLLTSLEFDLSAPPAIFFLRRFSKAAGVSNGTAPMMIHSMAKFIMELTVLDYSTCHLLPSEQAASALALSMFILDKEKSLNCHWTPTLEHYSSISFDSLKRILLPVATMLSKYMEEPRKLNAVFLKYSRNRCSRVSVAPEIKVEEWKDRISKELCQ